MRYPLQPIQAWSSWDAVVAFYGKIAENNPSLETMVEFTSRIAASRYAGGLFPGMSVGTLLIGQTPVFEWKREVLEVQALRPSSRLRFDFWERPETKDHWSRECEASEAFALLEWLLHRKHWFLRTGP